MVFVGVSGLKENLYENPFYQNYLSTDCLILLSNLILSNCYNYCYL